MRHDPPTNRDEVDAGFTLLEVLIGLVISTLILSGLSLAMGSVNRGYEQMGEAIDRQGAISTGLSVFGQDVSRIVRVPEDNLKPEQFVFSGRPREMIYVLAERPGSNEAGLYWVRLLVRDTVDGNQLVRQRAPFRRPLPAIGSIAWTDDVILVSGKLILSFSYRSPRAGLRGWAGRWDAVNMLPGQIRVDVTDAATGRLRVPAYTATLKISAEAACASAIAPGCTIKTEGKLVPVERTQQ